MKKILVLIGWVQVVMGILVAGSPYWLKKAEVVHIHHPYAYPLYLLTGGSIALLSLISLYLTRDKKKGGTS